MVKNVHWSACKVPGILVLFKRNLNILFVNDQRDAQIHFYVFIVAPCIL